MPYNYIIDEEIRSRTDIDLERCIIIIDEGHNIGAVAEQS
jgi:regulator of telomere elongation helicase 1